MWSRAAKWSTLKLNDGGWSCGVEDLNRAERIYEMCGAKQWRTWTAMKWLGLWVMLMRCLQPKKKKENERTVCIPWSDHPCPLTSAIVCIVGNKPRRYVSVDMRFGLRALFFFGSKFDLGILCFRRVSLYQLCWCSKQKPSRIWRNNLNLRASSFFDLRFDPGTWYLGRVAFFQLCWCSKQKIS